MGSIGVKQYGRDFGPTRFRGCKIFNGDWKTLDPIFRGTSSNGSPRGMVFGPAKTCFEPQTPNPESHSVHPKPKTLNPRLETPNSKPETPNPKLQTPYPQLKATNPTPRCPASRLDGHLEPRTPNPKSQSKKKETPDRTACRGGWCPGQRRPSHRRPVSHTGDR